MVFGQKKNRIKYQESEFSFPIRLEKAQKTLNLNFYNGLCYKGTVDENSVQAFYDDIGQAIVFGDQQISKEEFRKSNVYAISFENDDITDIEKYVSNISEEYHRKFSNLKRSQSNVEMEQLSNVYKFEPNFYKANLSEDIVIVIYQYFNKQINKTIISTSFCYRLKEVEIEEFIYNRGLVVSRYLKTIQK